MSSRILATAETFELLRSGIAEAIRASTDTQAGEALTGFALCTDDDLTTLYAAASSRTILESVAVRGARFQPTEWPEAASGSIAVVSKALQHRSEKDFAEGIAGDFEALVQALLELRNAGLFAPSAFLTVLSTDPSPHMERLERSATVRLNPPEVLRDWRLWLLEEAELRLSRLEQTEAPLSYTDEDALVQTRREVNQLRAELEVR